MPTLSARTLVTTTRVKATLQAEAGAAVAAPTGTLGGVDPRVARGPSRTSGHPRLPTGAETNNPEGTTNVVTPMLVPPTTTVVTPTVAPTTSMELVRRPTPGLSTPDQVAQV